MVEDFDQQPNEEGFEPLDEMLCEYVDGTMEDGVRAAFEECLCADRELAERVDRLRCTRSLLCHYGGRQRLPEQLRRRVQRRLACELASETVCGQSPRRTELSVRLTNVASLTSSVVAALVLGVLVGELWLADPQSADATFPAPPAYTHTATMWPWYSSTSDRPARPSHLYQQAAQTGSLQADTLRPVLQRTAAGR